MKINIVSRTKIWIAISIVFIIFGGIIIGTNGLNFGVDFAGGTFIHANIGEAYNVDEIRGIISDLGIQGSVAYAGENNEDVIIRTIDSDRQGEIVDSLMEKYGLVPQQVSIDTVGPTIGRELTRNALTSVIIAAALILLYIWIRFEIKSGIAAIVALIHDVLVMFAVVAILQVQINVAFVAALLTIIGYSINDTIILFDRIRENSKKFGRKLSGKEIVNKSIGETIVRTLNTSLTTFFVITALYVFGVELIKEFSLPLLTGIVSGTYSSIFIASPIWAMWNDKKTNQKALATK